jgi:hypothetical protein
LFLETFASIITKNFKRALKEQELSLLGALYLDKVSRKFKSFLQFLSEKPVTKFTQEMTEITQLLICENLEEVESYLGEKTELIVNKIIKISEIKELLSCRVDLPSDKLEALFKNY